jgi:hypothetical protein
VAIGSAPEIGAEFRTGTKDIHYPWIVDGKQNQLMYGDSKLVYVKGRPENIYPPEGHDWEFSRGVFVLLDNEAKEIDV